MTKLNLNYFPLSWHLCIFLCLGFYCKSLFKKLHWSFALAVTYTILQTYLNIAWLETALPYSEKVIIGLIHHHQVALIVLLLFTFLMSVVTVNEKWMSYLCCLNIALTSIFWFFPLPINMKWLSGLAVNPSMNGSITAMTWPFLFLLKESLLILPLAALGIVLIFASKSTTPVLAFLAIIFLPFALRAGKKAKLIAAGLLTGSIAAAIAFIPNFIHPYDRMQQYMFFWRLWRERFNAFVGSGNGSFYIWGPLSQKLNLVETDRFFDKLFNGIHIPRGATAHWYYLWLHSDIYQTLFELGIIGLSLWSVAVFYILKSLYHSNNRAWLSAAIGWLITATFYYPLHYPVHLAIGLMIATVAIKKEEC